MAQAPPDLTAFAEPDFESPLDPRPFLDEVPDAALVRGMFPGAVARMIKRGGHDPGTNERFVQFKYYPLKEHMMLLVRAAEVLWPDLPRREALRRIGHQGLPTLRDSMVGRVLVSLAGTSSLRGGLSLVTKAYAATRRLGSARVTYLDPGQAVVELRDLYDFPGAVHVGIFEASIRELGMTGRLLVRTHSPTDLDLLITPPTSDETAR